jgi:addiction module HigA family antidote
VRRSTIQRQRKPTHPGEVLREDIIPAMGISIAEFARAIHVSRQTVHSILAEKKPVTPAMAVRFGKFIGNGPQVWLDMQQACDLWLAEHELAEEIKHIRTHNVA